MSAWQKKGGFERARQRMLEQDLAGRDVVDPRVLRAMAEVPRERFVPAEHRFQAYADGPLPIGHGQTISQPYIVALMTQELHVDGNCEVLEIGTGSGYQTAVLCKLARKVFTIEKVPELSQSARKVLGDLGITNVEFSLGDGSCGWPEQRCFERIMITAAVPRLPEPILAQLADGGIVVAPVGGAFEQRLIACEKRNGKLVERFVCGVRFVKLLGEHAFRE